MTTAVTFTRNPYRDVSTTTTTTQRRENTEKAAVGAGVGGAALSNKGLRQGIQKAISFSTTAKENTIEAKGLWGKFLKDTKIFSASIMNRISKFKDLKYIGPVLKNPAVRLVAGGVGAVMAFFALVTGVSKAIRNGRLAVGDLKDRFNEALG
ncbi:hypothetical protein IJ596_03795 [bacterium]|nr:hypothetical protein [bacterium]